MPSRLPAGGRTGLTGVSSDRGGCSRLPANAAWLTAVSLLRFTLKAEDGRPRCGGPREHRPHAWLISDRVAREQGRGADRTRPGRQLGWMEAASAEGGLHGASVHAAAQPGARQTATQAQADLTTTREARLRRFTRATAGHSDPLSEQRCHGGGVSGSGEARCPGRAGRCPAEGARPGGRWRRKELSRARGAQGLSRCEGGPRRKEPGWGSAQERPEVPGSPPWLEAMEPSSGGAPHFWGGVRGWARASGSLCRWDRASRWALEVQT